MGRSDLFLKLEIVKKVAGIAVLAGTVWFGPLIIAYSALVLCAVSQIINTWPNRKLLQYGYLEQLKDILPSVFLSIVMGGIVYGIGFLTIPVMLTLVIQAMSGIIIYVCGSWLMRLEGYYYVSELLKNVRKKIKKKGKV